MESNYYKIVLPNPADATLVNALGPVGDYSSSDNWTRLLYAGDTQGNLWKFDFTKDAPWKASAETNSALGLSGFTLIEMMVVVALVAILGTIAVPGFRDLLLNQRLASNTSDFVAALSLARAEAMKRSQKVALEPIDDDWSNGWEVAMTVGNEREVLRTFDGLRTGVVVDTSSTTGGLKQALAYDANGFLSSKAAGCLTLKAETGRRSSIVLAMSGRPKLCDPDKSGDCASSGSTTCRAVAS
ncbi:GspH/FimT family pseudopilin [Variovorax sp. Sphag1AA]|uniref:GspH/FimT family pseudopilin n=1 Tax=Variovorax sp. Sphag1AA TaxID=2587027 RepID=UPI00160D4A25|nr:GspH/FimT family pseudopilin [Variovorax sp. Sphag1AA]MBB3175977.1 prepilin-type N-terminal cleavage/methylation domain-containing protein [Variovorax sp. Sphag1AA]